MRYFTTGIFLFLFATPAFASIGTSASSPLTFPKSITVNNPDIMEGGHSYVIFKANGEVLQTRPADAYDPVGFTFSPPRAGQYLFLECNSTASGGSGCPNGYSSYDEAVSNLSYVGSFAFTWRQSISNPPSVSDVMDNLGDSSGSVFSGLYPYLLIGLGIFAAFLIGHRIISLSKYGLSQKGSGSDTDQIRKTAGDRVEGVEEIKRQFPLM